MKYIRTLTIVAAIVFTFAGCSPQTTVQEPQKPKNVILFIGDGMGVAQVYSGLVASGLSLNIMQFPYAGFSLTYSESNYTTDSGAGGTAIACGVKTANRHIGTTSDGSSVASIAEIAHDNGLASGVVAVSTITHATPASFVAHNESRDNYEEIALNFLDGKIDVFIGGGEDHFNNRQDGRDLTTDLKNQGFDVVYNLEEMKASSATKLAGLLSKKAMPAVLEGREGYLPEMTRKAIEVLSKDDDGFFLMVEGSFIDSGGHDNDLEKIIAEMCDMDSAVGVALDFAKNNGETLIVITADHETGGLTLPAGSIADKTSEASFTTKSHTGVMVPIFSYGPGAEKFAGIHENTFFKNEFMNQLGIN